VAGISPVETDKPNIPVPQAPVIVMDDAPKTAVRKPRSSAEAKKKRAAAMKAKEQVQVETMKLAEQNLSMLLGAISAITATRMGEHWNLSPDEIQSIAAPTARIMARHDLVEKANEYGDYAALVIAVGAATIPRMMIHQQIKQQEAKARATFNQPIPVPNPPTTGTGGTSETSPATTGDETPTGIQYVTHDGASDDSYGLTALSTI